MLCRIGTFFCGVVMLALGLTVGAARADDAWVRIEAKSSLSEAEARARDYARTLPNVNGFRLPSGWYAIVLGPYPAEDATQQLGVLKGEGLIPRDSFVTDTAQLGERFWPVGNPDTAGAAQPATATADAAPDRGASDATTATPPATAPGDTAVVAAVAEETPQEARRSESALTTEERQMLQTAMQWQGFYTGKIDGSFGPGTRNSMAAWQAANGKDTTGILTTTERATLIAAYQADLAAIGMKTVTDEKSGIEIALPSELVGFSRYQPPFVQYDEKNGSGYQVLLISREGDQNALYGLFDVMQTLKIVPIDGERTRDRNAFTITGQNGKLQSYTRATLDDGFIKGFTLVWPASDAARAEKILAAMKSSFQPVGDHALDDSIGQPLDPSAGDLTAGLEVRRPVVSRSGFFVDAAGDVMTTTEVNRQCARFTIDGSQNATVLASDPATGLMLLRPETPLAPPGFADFDSAQPRARADVAVSGYSYEDALDAPVTTFGTFEEPKGLDGETDVARLTLRALPGDAGGPVLTPAGSVLGMLLPRQTGAKVLPDDVAYARSATALMTLMAAQGIAPVPAEAGATLADEDIARRGRAMTVLVSCWE